MKKLVSLLVSAIIVFTLVGCGDTKEKESKQGEIINLKVLAAASLTDVLTEIGDLYSKKENVTFTFNFDSSGTLKTQIENGAPADIFFSAAQKQMQALEQIGLIEDGSIVNILENKVVLIKPKGSPLDITSFEEVATDKVNMVAIGNNDVPVGQYTETIYKNLNLWDAVQVKANLGTNVRQVLDWVATSNVDCGIVYATDAAIEDQVEVVSEAPTGSFDPVIYPAGIINTSKQQEESQKFLAFLQSKEAIAIFNKYGFQEYTE